MKRERKASWYQDTSHRHTQKDCSKCPNTERFDHKNCPRRELRHIVSCILSTNNNTIHDQEKNGQNNFLTPYILLTVLTIDFSKQSRAVLSCFGSDTENDIL